MSKFNEIIDRLKTGTDRVTEMVGDAAKTAASKVETKTREAKIRYAIHEVEERMQANFEAIGAAVYRSYKADEEYEDFSELFGRIDALEDEISDLKNQLYTECDLQLCSKCNATMHKSDAFCPKCGVKIKDE